MSFEYFLALKNLYRWFVSGHALWTWPYRQGNDSLSKLDVASRECIFAIGISRRAREVIHPRTSATSPSSLVALRLQTPARR
jgi:hypothetical protein